MQNLNLTGYPSIDKPWLKYYKEEDINSPLPKCTLFDYIYMHNRSHLDNVALNYFGRKITYRQLFKNIENVSQSFSSLGVKEGDIVTIASISTPETIYAFYALNRLGAISNMIDPRTSADGIKHYIEEVHSKIVISIDASLSKVKEAIAGTSVKKVICLSPYISLPATKRFVTNVLQKLKGAMPIPFDNCIFWNDFIKLSALPNYPTYKEDTCCTIVHTGGTTGLPKGVMLSNDNINAAAHQCNICGTNFNCNDKWLNIMPPFIAYGVGNGLHLPLAIGMEVILIPKFDPQKFDRLLIKHTPNHITGVPSHYSNVISSKKLRKKQLSYLISPIVGGDSMLISLEKDTNAFLSRHGCSQAVMKGYGMSEVCAAVSLTSGKDRNSTGSVGIPFTHTIISIFDVGTGVELKYGQLGEVCMTGPNTMLGYYESEKETNSILRTHPDGKVWVHSGDVGYMKENGELFIVDRIKRVIIRHDGFKVFPSQIERTISLHKAVVSCCTVGVKDSSHSQGFLPVAFIVLTEKNQQKDIKKELLKLCQNKLPEYAQPKDLLFVDKLPLTPIGKADFHKLEDLANAAFER